MTKKQGSWRKAPASMRRQRQVRRMPKSLAKSFCEQTTAHGFSNFVREQLLIVRICWIVVLLAASFMICVHLYSVVSKYLEYQVQEVTMLSMKPPPFPAVTVCSLQPYSRRLVYELWDNDSMVSNRDLLSSMENSSVDCGTTWYAASERALSPIFMFENIGWEASMQIGHQHENFIAGCTFLGEDCRTESFSLFVHPIYYNCYTFTANTSGESPQAIGAGPENSLSLILYLESSGESENKDGRILQKGYNHRSEVENCAGARVVIHSQGELPQVVTAGLDIMPGHSTSIPVSVELIKKKDSPYGTCLTNTSVDGVPEFAYTSDTCLQVKNQEYIYEHCGCIMAALPLPVHLRKKTFCGVYNPNNPKDYFNRTAL